MIEKQAESKLQSKELSMSFCSLQYEDFENQIKRYGYIGTVTQQHMDEVKLTKRFLKNNELKENSSRQA